MSSIRTLITATALLAGFAALSCEVRTEQQPQQQRDSVTIDYAMAERAVDWLDLINSGADDDRIREDFMTNVAPTAGCQSIIHHWARFMEWDDEKLLRFILEALGRVETDRPLENEDGSLTSFGKRRMLWTSALKDPDRLRHDLQNLKQMNLAVSAAALARQFLPDNARLNADFYVVLFGGSSAYSVGDENGFDLLQMHRKPDGTLDVDEARRTFAHELHHTGFASLNDSISSDETLLVGILAAEGMPTHFIDGFPGVTETYAAGNDKIRQDLARIWNEHQARLAELYAEAAADIESCLDHEMDGGALFEKWMGGLKGPAYVLGADMYSVIDEQLGLDSAKAVVCDSRRFLSIYNEAALKANAEGANCFVFDDSLARRVADYPGDRAAAP